jgi:biotin carboxyl carrier protein
MKFTVELNGKARTVELSRGEKGFTCSIDGKPVGADIVEIGPGTYSVLIGGQSLEVRITPRPYALAAFVGGHEYALTVGDPREWRRKHGGAAAFEGRQQVVAPMPGKVIRILAKVGEKVEARQGLVVVEAMKMQNEVRAPKSGMVEKIMVAEGQSVNAGDALATIG